jgi:hypothetical protein
VDHAPGTPPTHPIKVLPSTAWIGDLELGTEVVGGSGLVEVTGFALDVQPRIQP